MASLFYAMLCIAMMMAASALGWGLAHLAGTLIAFQAMKV